MHCIGVCHSERQNDSINISQADTSSQSVGVLEVLKLRRWDRMQGPVFSNAQQHCIQSFCYYSEDFGKLRLAENVKLKMRHGPCVGYVCQKFVCNPPFRKQMRSFPWWNRHRNRHRYVCPCSPLLAEVPWKPLVIFIKDKKRPLRPLTSDLWLFN